MRKPGLHIKLKREQEALLLFPLARRQAPSLPRPPTRGRGPSIHRESLFDMLASSDTDTIYIIIVCVISTTIMLYAHVTYSQS